MQIPKHMKEYSPPIKGLRLSNIENSKILSGRNRIVKSTESNQVLVTLSKPTTYCTSERQIVTVPNFLAGPVVVKNKGTKDNGSKGGSI